MLKGLSFLALRAFPLLLLSAPAWAGSTVSVSVNGGPQTAYTDSQGTFSISTLNGGGGNNASGALVSFSAPSLGHFVTMDFLPLGGQTLGPGIYDNVQHVGAQSPLQPGLSVQVDDVFCNSASGRFVVHSITRSGTTITSLDADFQQNCLSSTGTVTSTVTGSLRYMDTTPIPYPTPTADAGTNQIVTQGATVVLDGSLSLPGNGTITAYTWTQLSGVSVTLNDVSTVAPSFTAPSVPLGGSDLVFQLQVDNSLADSSIGTVKVHVANPADPESIYSYTSDSSNDPVGRGGSGSFGVLQAIFTPSTLTSTASHAGSGVQVTVNAGPANSWTLQFAAPVGESLQVGMSYDLAQSAPASAAGVPALDAQTTFSPGSCATAFGRFTVLDLQTDVDGNVASFAADFVQNCSGKQASLHGKIRYNSSVPLDDPFADAGGEMLGVPGAVITLSATGSDAGDGQDITSYQWVQVSGPTVTLSDPSAASPTFTAPGVGSTGTDLVFQLTVTNADGLSGTDEVTVHLPGSSEPVSVLTVVSDAGDALGQGATIELDTIHASFSPANFTNTIGTGFSIAVKGTSAGSGSWNLFFEAPAGQTLQVGSYDSAVKEPATQTSLPGMFVTPLTTVQCFSVTGHFTVLDIQRDGSGNVTSFAADFEQHCNGATAGLRGKIRYNSTVPVDDPIVQTGAAQWVMQGDVATLDASGSDPGGAGVTLTGYQWTQLSGAGVTLSDVTAAQPTFTAPNVAPGGADLTFQVTVTNSVGVTATGTAKVHVASAGDPTPTSVLYLNSTAGEPIGQGQSQSIGSGQASFTVAALSNGLKATVTAASQTWTLTMFPPTGQLPQSPKTYDNAGRATTSGFFPELSVENSGSGCSFSTGRFSILELQTDANGTITSLAVDFVQYCDDLPAPLYGKLRYNSGVALTTPFADAGPAQETPQETQVTLGGSSYAGGGGATITSYQWTQLSGPAVSLSDAMVAQPTFTAPAVDAGGADLAFQLTVTNSLGLSGSDTVTVHVTNPADPVTVFQAFSDAGDPAGGGQSANLNSVQAGFSATLNGSSISYTVAGVQGGWTVTLAPPSGQSLQVGDYESAVGYPDQAPVLPGMAVFAGNNRCHPINGHFTVLQVQRNGNGLITGFAADFTQHCNGLTAALRGRLRINSNIPLDTPFPDAGASQTVSTGNSTVTLSAGGSDAGGNGETITSIQWTQVSGTTVSLSDATSSSPTFSTAGLTGNQDLVFEVTVTNSDGVSSTDEVIIHVQDPAGPKTRLYMESDPGDFVGQGATTDFNQYAALLRGAASAGTMAFVANAGDLDNFALDFSAESGQSFQLNQFYTQAQRLASSTSPGIEITGNGHGCNEDDGSFIVRDFQKDGSGNITELAVDFVQYCEDGTAGLYGWLRLNSAVPMDTPFAAAGPAQSTYAGMPVTLDGSGSHVGPDGTLNYTWTQVVASGDPVVTITPGTGGKATFVAPSVPAGGKTLTFQLAVDNGHGMTSTATVLITVGSQSDPKTLFYFNSALTDPAGMGTSGMLTSADHDMSQVYESQDGASVPMQPIPPLDTNWLFEFSENENTPASGPGTGTFFVTPGSDVPPFMLATMGDQDCEGGLAGTYVVRDIGVQTNGEGSFTISRLAVDFIQFCDGSTGPLIGAYRYNSKTTMLTPPAANAGPTLSVNSPGLVTLDGSASFPGIAGPVTYSWKQTAGPAVTLQNGTQAVAQFVLPLNLMTLEGTPLKFALTVTNAYGSSTAAVKVTAALPATSTLALQSDVGDPMGSGHNYSYATPADMVSVNAHGGNVNAKVRGADGKVWTLQFAAPKGQPLKAGSYTGAVPFKLTSEYHPGMDVHSTGGWSHCRLVGSDFQVLQVLYDKNGAIDSLAVNFDQTCAGASGALHGQLRSHSLVP
jgi:hypothetical protein